MSKEKIKSTKWHEVSGCSITPTIGSVNSFTVRENDNLVYFQLFFKNSNAVSEGSNIFEGRLNGISVTGVYQQASYYGDQIAILQMDGASIRIRMSKGTSSSNSIWVVSAYLQKA